VLLDEVISFLHPEQKGTYLDCTIGAGGHSREILERIVPGGSLVGIDQDKEMLNLAEKRLKNYGKNLKLIQSDFAHISEIFKKGERFTAIDEKNAPRSPAPRSFATKKLKKAMTHDKKIGI